MNYFLCFNVDWLDKKIKEPYVASHFQANSLNNTHLYFPDNGSGKRHFIKCNINLTNAAVSNTIPVFCPLFVVFINTELFKLSEMKWRS